MLTNNSVMQEAADALLDAGISLPLVSLRLPWSKRAMRLGITMRRPTLGSLIRVSRKFLELGFTTEEIEGFSESERIAFMASRGKALSELLALACLRGKLSGAVFYRPLAWLIRWRMPVEIQLSAMFAYMSLSSTQSFTPFISYVAAMSPLLSHGTEGS